VQKEEVGKEFILCPQLDIILVDISLYRYYSKRISSHTCIRFLLFSLCILSSPILLGSISPLPLTKGQTENKETLKLMTMTMILAQNSCVNKKPYIA